MLRSSAKLLFAAVLAATGSFFVRGVAAAQPTSQDPAPAAAPDAQVSRLASLITATVMDRDARVRENSRHELLTLSASELPALREAVALLAQGRRLSVPAAAVAHDVVFHVMVREAKARFLAEQPQEERSGMAFLGIMLGGDLYGQSSGSSNGIPVRTTMVGFAAYEVFEAGDLLIAMRTVRGVEILSDFGDLRRSFTDLAPRDPVEFFVSRGGVVLRVSFHLDERIEQGTPMSLRWDRAHDEARRAAAEYWEEQFAPLLPRSGSAVARGD